MGKFIKKRFGKRGSLFECEYCGYRIAKPFPKDCLCPKCGKFLADLFDLSKPKDILPVRLNTWLACENCQTLFDYPEGYPQIDGETFRLCPECFGILQKVVQDIAAIFDENEEDNNFK